MKETYTFSRALHLMRYSGKKMRSTLWIGDRLHTEVIKGILKIVNTTGMKGTPEQILEMFEIMGSWEEVK